MKMAFPFEGGLMSSHFGHCKDFLVIELDTNTMQVTAKNTMSPPENEEGCGFLPKWLTEIKVDTVMAKGMGEGMRRNLEKTGIKVVFCKEVQTPEEMAVAYAKGKLASDPSVNSCDHGPDHSCHDHGHGHGHSLGRLQKPCHGKK